MCSHYSSQREDPDLPKISQQRRAGSSNIVVHSTTPRGTTVNYVSSSDSEDQGFTDDESLMGRHGLGGAVVAVSYYDAPSRATVGAIPVARSASAGKGLASVNGDIY